MTAPASRNHACAGGIPRLWHRQLRRLGDRQLMQAPRSSSCTTDLRLQRAPPQHAKILKQRNPVASTDGHACWHCLPGKDSGTGQLDNPPGRFVRCHHPWDLWQWPGTPSACLHIKQQAGAAASGKLATLCMIRHAAAEAQLQHVACQRVWLLSNKQLGKTLTCVVAGQEGHCSGASIWHMTRVAGPKHLLRLSGELDFGDGSCNCQGS